MLGVEDFVGVFLSHDESLETLAVLCLVRLERITRYLCDDSNLCRHDFLEGDAHIADSRSACRLSEVEHVAILMHVFQIHLVVLRHAVGHHCSRGVSHHGLSGCRLGSGLDTIDLSHAFIDVGKSGRVDVEQHRFSRRDRMDERLIEFVGTKCHVLSPLLLVLVVGHHMVLALIGRIVESAAVDRSRHPFLRISIGSGSDLLSAKLVFALTRSMLYPLVVFHVANEADGLFAQVELAVRQRVFGGCHCRGAHHFAFERLVDFARVFHVDAHLLCLVEHFVGFHRPALVPPQQRRGSDKHQESWNDTSEGVFHSCSVTSSRNFLICHFLMISD